MTHQLSIWELSHKCWKGPRVGAYQVPQGRSEQRVKSSMRRPMPNSSSFLSWPVCSRTVEEGGLSKKEEPEWRNDYERYCWVQMGAYEFLGSLTHGKSFLGTPWAVWCRLESGSQWRKRTATLQVLGHPGNAVVKRLTMRTSSWSALITLLSRSSQTSRRWKRSYGLMLTLSGQ